MKARREHKVSSSILQRTEKVSTLKQQLAIRESSEKVLIASFWTTERSINSSWTLARPLVGLFLTFNGDLLDFTLLVFIFYLLNSKIYPKTFLTSSLNPSCQDKLKKCDKKSQKFLFLNGFPLLSFLFFSPAQSAHSFRFQFFPSNVALPPDTTKVLFMIVKNYK